MYIAILQTHYEIYAIGATEAEAQRHIVEGYKTAFSEGYREFDDPTFEDLRDFFGCIVSEIDPAKGWTL